MLEDLPKVLLLYIIGFLTPIDILSIVPLLSRKWYSLMSKLEIRGELDLSSTQTSNLVKLLPGNRYKRRSLKACYYRGKRVWSKLTIRRENCRFRKPVQLALMCSCRRDNSRYICTLKNFVGSSSSSEKKCQSMLGYLTPSKEQSTNRKFKSRALKSKFALITGIKLTLDSFSQHRGKLLYFLLKIAPPSLRNLTLKADNMNNFCFMNAYEAKTPDVSQTCSEFGSSIAAPSRRGSDSESMPPVERKREKGKRKNKKNQKRVSTMSYREKYPYIASFSEERNEGFWENQGLSKDVAYNRVPELWLLKKDWARIFERFRDLEKLSVALNAQKGCDEHRIIELELPETQGDRYFMKFNRSPLHNLKDLTVKNIASDNFSVNHKCYLPNVQKLRLGFREVNMGLHDIRPLFRNIHLRNTQDEWETSNENTLKEKSIKTLDFDHPLKELHLHTDNDENEQLRLALLVNRLIERSDYSPRERADHIAASGISHDTNEAIDSSWSISTRYLSDVGNTLRENNFEASIARDNNGITNNSRASDLTNSSSHNSSQIHPHSLTLSQLEILQVPRIALISPSLSKLAPSIREIRSFESWEFSNIAHYELFARQGSYRSTHSKEKFHDTLFGFSKNSKTTRHKSSHLNKVHCECGLSVAADTESEDSPLRFETPNKEEPFSERKSLCLPDGCCLIGKQAECLNKSDSLMSGSQKILYNCLVIDASSGFAQNQTSLGRRENLMKTQHEDDETNNQEQIFPERLQCAVLCKIIFLEGKISNEIVTSIHMEKTPSVIRLQQLLPSLGSLRRISFYQPLGVPQLIALKKYLEPFVAPSNFKLFFKKRGNSSSGDRKLFQSCNEVQQKLNDSTSSSSSSSSSSRRTILDSQNIANRLSHWPSRQKDIANSLEREQPKSDKSVRDRCRSHFIPVFQVFEVSTDNLMSESFNKNSFVLSCGPNTYTTRDFFIPV